LLLTFEQLGKFVAISLKWPLFLLELENDPQLFKKFYDNKYNFNIGLLDKFALHSTARSWGWEDQIFRYWLSQDKFRKLLADGYGYQSVLDDPVSPVYVLDPKFNLAEVNVEKLLQVSPKVVRPTVESEPKKETVDQILGYIPVDMSEHYQMKRNPYTGAILLPGGIELEMMDIPAGKFLMGSDENDNQKPIHEITVNAFKMGKYPVTQSQYEAVMGTNPSHFSGNPQNPVENVSWFDAQAFCERLSELTGEKYRLPTEAEWEYACRAGTQTRFSFGDDESQLGDYAWFNVNSDDKTHSVGEKRANPWGLYDMHGNLWEWCADQWHESYADKPENLKQNGNTAWTDGNINTRTSVMQRGGSWVYDPFYCRSAIRFSIDAGGRNDDIGFRVVVFSP
jgi:formylglycine-generating enzyme required for sulfatase activity